MEKITINGIVDPQYYIDKWTNWALEATPATDEQIIANVQTLYDKANLKKPEVKVFRDYEKFINYNWSSVRVSVRVSVYASIRASVSDSIYDSVCASISASVSDTIRDSVYASIGASVSNNVYANVSASVSDTIRDSVRASVDDSVNTSVGAWYWADYLSFADVFVDTNVLSKEKAQELEEYKKLLETQRISVLTKNIAYVLVAPTIRREDGRLHSDQKPAVEWENETGQYYLDGVNLSKDLWQKILSNTMTFAEIMKIDISDKRTVALKYNPQAILNEGSTLIDRKERSNGLYNELYLIEGKQINEDLEAPKIWFLKMKCPTGRMFIEGVDPTEAEKNPDANYQQALLCGLTLQEYLSMELES